MRPSGQFKHFAFAFLIALVGYAVLYNLIEHSRTRGTPWEVTFMLTNGTPAMVIRQDRLASQPRTVMFRENSPVNRESLKPETIRFNEARPVPFPVPFGRCIFLDTTFMPGTIVFEVFGHTVELMPKALIIDDQAHEWNSEFRELEAKSLK